MSRGYVVYAFEPNPVYIERVAKRIDKANRTPEPMTYIAKLDEKGDLLEPLPSAPSGKGFCYLIPAAASDVKGSTSFYLSESASSVVDTRLQGRTESIKVPMVRIDDIVHVTEIFYMMVDVQGFEVKALQGASSLFAAEKVRSLVVELTPQLLEPERPDGVAETERVWKLDGHGTRNLLQLLLKEYQLQCFDMRNAVKKGTASPLHPEAAEEYIAYTTQAANKRREIYFGYYEDLLCLRGNRHL